MKPTEKQLSEILSKDKDICYDIPLYQREYTWGQHEWDVLFSDIIENEKGYFLGSIIAVRENDRSVFEEERMQIIDGQQRLTSVSIFLLAIYNELNKYLDVMNKPQRREFEYIADEISKETSDDNSKFLIKLTLQEKNNNDYLYLLYSLGLYDKNVSTKYEKNRKVYKAYYHFSKLVEEYLNETIDVTDAKGKVKKLLELQDKINSTIFIEADSNKDAYMLFESLNNRGVPLSALDLLKNLLISRAEVKHDVKGSYHKWQEILRYLGEEYSVQERFFRQYYNAFREELNKPFKTDNIKAQYPLAYMALKSNLLAIYERLMNQDYNEILNKLVEGAKTYSVIVNNNQEVLETDLGSNLLNLEKIQGVPSYLLLLYLFIKKK